MKLKEDESFYLNEEERIKLIKLIQHFKEELISIPLRIIKEAQLLKKKLKIYTDSMELLEQYKPFEDESITDEDILDIINKLVEIEQEIVKNTKYCKVVKLIQLSLYVNSSAFSTING